MHTFQENGKFVQASFMAGKNKQNNHRHICLYKETKNKLGKAVVQV
jgi:hypothetical protein